MKTFLVLSFLLLTPTLSVNAGNNFPIASESMKMMRQWKLQRTRTPPSDSINSALSDLEIDYGSNDPTKQEKLLQLSCNGDNKGVGWRYDRCANRSWLRPF